MPKSYGVLGIFSLLTRRRASLCKLVAQLILHPTSLWGRVISAKYHFVGSWTSYSFPWYCSAF